jgi:hypothetical protein
VIESLERRLTVSGTQLTVADYAATVVGTFHGMQRNLHFILEVTGVGGSRIEGRVVSPQAGIFTFDGVFKPNSSGKGKIILANGAGYLDGRFADDNTKFIGLIVGKTTKALSASFSLKRICACQVH